MSWNPEAWRALTKIGGASERQSLLSVENFVFIDLIHVHRFESCRFGPMFLCFSEVIISSFGRGAKGF